MRRDYSDFMTHLLFIFNRHSGTGGIKSHLADIIDEFNKGGYEVTAYSTQERGQATELAEKFGESYPLIVCSGGDGTLNEVLEGIMKIPEEKRPKVGYIPAGSTNDFASSIGLPTVMKKCAEMIVKGNFRKLDVGKFQERHFVYVAAFGAFTEVSYNTPQETKNIFGHQAYILEGIKQVANIRPYHMKVVCEDKVIEKDFVYGMVYNAESVGGMKNLSGQKVELDDGLLDVMLIQSPVQPVEWPALLADFVMKNEKSPYITNLKAKEIEFHSDEPVDWVLDGEYGGAHRDVTIDTCHKALTIAVKSKKEDK